MGKVKSSYPQNLLNDIFDEPVLVSGFPNCEDSIEWLLDGMPEKWADCIRLRYQDNYTFEQIGKTIGVTKARVDQLLQKTILELKKPESIKCIELGVEEYQNHLKEEQERKNIEKANRTLYEIPIEELELSGRAYNALKRNDINSVGQLSELDKLKLSSLRNMGDGSAEEVMLIVREFIAKRNLDF